MPTIVIADDDRLARESLKTILESGSFTVPALAADGNEAVSLWNKLKPDLLLLDIRMQPKSGLEAARDVLSAEPGQKILLLTTFKDQAYISEALALGCRGYLLKQNFPRLLPSVRAVLAGSLVFDSEIFDRLTAAPAPASPSERLGEREEALLTAIAEGLQNKEIAERLHLSEGTVRNNISELLETLGLRDRTQLAIYYYKRLLNERGR